MIPNLVMLASHLLNLLSALGPGMLGAAVGQAWKPGLTWRQRLVQWVVGVSCAYYVALAVIHGLGWHPYVAQGVAFIVGMCAFEVAPRLVAALSQAAAGLPDVITKAAGDFLARWTKPGGGA